MGIRDWFRGGHHDYDRDYHGYGRDYTGARHPERHDEWRARGERMDVRRDVLPHGRGEGAYGGSAMGPHWDERPYRRSERARGYPATRRGLGAGGRQGPGRAWGMGGNVEMESEHARYDFENPDTFGEARTPGMGGDRGSHFSFGMGGRSNMEGLYGMPGGRPMGAGPLAMDSLGGYYPRNRGAWGRYGHTGDVRGDRYLRGDAYRGEGWHRGSSGGPTARTSYGAEFDRVRRGQSPQRGGRAAGWDAGASREGPGRESMSRRYDAELGRGYRGGDHTTGRSPGRAAFDETRGGMGSGRGYRGGYGGEYRTDFDRDEWG